MAHKAHVDHLPATATQMQVSGLFTGCGRVLNVYVRKKGDEAWAFVNFATGKALDAALALDGMQFEGRTLAVTRSASLNPGPADGGGGAAAKKPAAAAASPPDKPPYPVVADTAASEPVTASTILTGTNVKMPSGGKGRGRGPEQRPGYRQPDFRPHTRWWERGQDHDARWKEHLRRRAEQRDELEGNIAEVPTQCWDGEYAHVVVEGTTCYRMFAAHGGEAISKRFDEEEGLYDLDDEDLEDCKRDPETRHWTLPLPKVGPQFFRFIIGAKGGTRDSIEKDTGGTIKVPKPGDPDQFVVIKGLTRAVCAAAKQRVDIVLAKCAHLLDYTHFISIPLTAARTDVAKLIDTLIHKYADKVPGAPTR